MFTFKKCFIVLALSLFATPVFADDSPVIRVFDIQRAIAASKAGKDLSRQIQERQTALEERAKKASTELRSAAERLNEQRTLISREQLQTRAEELKVKENAAQRDLNAQIRKLEESTQKATTAIGRIAAEQLQKIAKKHKADLVIRRDVLFNARADWDITDEVIALIDKKQTKTKLE